MTDDRERGDTQGEDAAVPAARAGKSVSSALLAAVLSCAASIPLAALGYFVIEIFYRNQLMGRDEGDVTTHIGGAGAVGDFLVALADGFVAAAIAGLVALWLLPRSDRRSLFLFSAIGYALLAVALWRYASAGGAGSAVSLGFWAATVFAGALAGSAAAAFIDLSEAEKVEPAGSSNEPPPTA